MRKIIALIYVALLVLGLRANADEKFSKLPTKEYLFLYEKSANVTNLEFSTIYTVAQVEAALHCHEFFIADILYGKDTPGFLIIGKEGETFKIVVILQGVEEEHRI